MISRQFSNLENVEIRQFKHLKEHNLGVEIIKFLEDQPNMLLSGSHDKSVKLWDVNKEKSVQSFSDFHDQGIWDLQYSASNGLVITTSPDSKINILDLKSNEKVHSFDTNLKKGYTLRLNKDQVLAGGQMGDIFLFDIKQRKLISQKNITNEIVYKIDYFKDKWILSTSEGDVYILENNLDILLKEKLTENEIRTFATSSTGQMFISFHDKYLRQYQIDLDKNQLVKIRQQDGHADTITSFCIDEKSNLLFTGSQDSSVYTWQLDKLIYQHNLIGHVDLISSMDVNSNEEFFATGSWDQSISIYRMSSILEGLL